MREALETDSRLIGPNSVRELAIDSHYEGLDEQKQNTNQLLHVHHRAGLAEGAARRVAIRPTLADEQKERPGGEPQWDVDKDVNS